MENHLIGAVSFPTFQFPHRNHAVSVAPQNPTVMCVCVCGWVGGWVGVGVCSYIHTYGGLKSVRDCFFYVITLKK
jgi:hypothetical protein